LMNQRGRRRVARNRRMISGKGIGGYIKMALAVAMIVASIIAVIRASSKSDAFLHGVYVNGVSMGGYTYQEGYEIVTELARQRLHENSIELFYGDKTWTLTPSMLNASMDVEAQLAVAWNFGHTGDYFQRKSQKEYLKNNTVECNSQLVYDEALIDQFIADIKSETDIQPKAASVIVEANEKLTITDSSPGQILDAGAVKEALVSVIVEGSAPRIELVPQVVQPSITAEELRSGTQLIASSTTSTKGSTSNRVANIRTSLNRFNGFVVHPGETFTFNRVVGRRTVENGFKEAPEFAGTSIQQGIGGGVCQASTTLYNALLRAGITIEERHQHTMTVAYIKPSLDATVSDGGKDLVFTNNRDSTIYIYTSVDDKGAQVKIFGKPTEYEIVLESETVQEGILDKNIRKEKDTSGKYAYYTDEMVLKSEGKTGLRSRAYICYYDRTTGDLIERDELHADYYFPSPSVYWVGVNERDADVLP
jgi:vancomycin resistance protein YoaR